MRARIVRIAELVDEIRIRGVLCNASCEVLVVLRMALADIGAGDHDLRPHGLEIRDLLAAHLVGNHEDQTIALLLRRQCQAQAGIARRALDQHRTGLEIAAALGLLDHDQTDSVLDRTARVLAFELDEQLAGAGIEVIDSNDRRVANQFEHVGVNAHAGNRW